MSNIKTRDEIAPEDKWDLTLMYATETDWDTEAKNIIKEIDAFSALQDHFKTNDEVLTVLQTYFKIKRRAGKLSSYAAKRHHEDETIASNISRNNKASDIYDALNKNSAFIDSALILRDDAFFTSIIADARFDEYKFMLERLKRSKEHILSQPEEKILASIRSLLDGPHDVHAKLDNSDLDFGTVQKDEEEIKISHANYSILLHDNNREIRSQVAHGMLGAYDKFRNTMSQNIQNHVKGNVTMAHISKYQSAEESFSFGDKMDSQVYTHLFDQTLKYAPSLQKYCQMRKRIMGLDELHYWDLYIPMEEEVEEKYSYDEACSIILESLSPLGPEYCALARKTLVEDRLVDKYENKNKRSGAYSGGGYDYPAYMLMNYNGSYNSMSTLAHELGHSMHTNLSVANQPYPQYGYSTFLAEVASTFNEGLLTTHLLKTADIKTKKSLINNDLEKIRGTFFRQAMFAMFEKKIYDQVENGETLTPDFLSNEYLELYRKLYGDTLVIDPLIAWEWARIPHFYYNFYVYTYATGLAISNYFLDTVLNGTEKERDNYLKLLKSGGSDYSLNLLKKSGLDLLNSNYIEMLMKKFEGLIDEFENI